MLPLHILSQYYWHYARHIYLPNKPNSEEKSKIEEFEKETGIFDPKNIPSNPDKILNPEKNEKMKPYKTWGLLLLIYISCLV